MRAVFVDDDLNVAEANTDSEIKLFYPTRLV